MIEPFTMPSPIARAVLEHLVAAMPNEGVGLIAVKPGFDRLACEFYPGTNTDRSPHRFTMDPAEVLAALRAMAARGWRLGAIVHSHPSSEPEPSETDLKEAYYDDVVTLIAGLAPRRPIFRGWRIRRRAGQSTVIEIPIVIGTEYG